jgi:rhamnosyltransferase
MPAYVPAPVAPASVTRRPGLTPIAKTVSVIIPTKNAGDDLRFLIRKLRAQEGISNIDIIVVDSGSQDATLDIAQQERIRILQIPPGQFTHASARNAGADAANGDYFLFIVQDALPMTTAWLHDLVSFLERHEVAALSCAEFPRADSDLFYQFLIHAQHKGSGLDTDRVTRLEDMSYSYEQLRAAAHLSDITALVRKEIFRTYRYRTAYAEDVDLGVRLLQEKHRLGFLYSTRVLHSHNRSPAYFLKRGYVDVRFLPEIFANYIYPDIQEAEHLYNEIFVLQGRVHSLSEITATESFPMTTRELIERTCSRMTADSASAIEIDADVQQLLDPIAALVGRSPRVKSGMIWPHVARHIERFGGWVSSIYEEADRNLASGIISSIGKIVSLHCGTHLGYLFMTRSARGSLDNALVEIDARLRAGV